MKARKPLHRGIRGVRITIASKKGGAGKTMAAIHLAAELARLEYKVLLVDSDQQLTALTWARVGAAAGRRVPNTVSMFALDKDLAGIEIGYDFILIDCPPGDARAQLAALAVADIALLPCVPGDDELYGSPHTPEAPRSIDEVRQAQRTNPALQAYVLISLKPRTKLAQRAREDLLAVPNGLPVLSSELTMRADYVFARKVGMGVTDMNPTGIAAGEVMALAREMLAIVKKRNAK